MPPTHDASVLRDTVSLVTGGASGLGASITSELASHGAHVVVLDPDADAADELVEQVARNGGSAEAVITDVRDADRLASAVDLAASRGSLFSVVSNAGGWGGVSAHFPVSDPDDWVRVSCVVPGWIALPRARGELAAIDAEERLSAPPLVPVGQLTDDIVRLIVDPSSGGEAVVLDGSEPPRPG